MMLSRNPIMGLCVTKDTQHINVSITVDFGEVKTSPTECKEKCFQMMSSAYLHFSKAPQNVDDSSKKEVR